METKAGDRQGAFCSLWGKMIERRNEETFYVYLSSIIGIIKIL